MIDEFVSVVRAESGHAVGYDGVRSEQEGLRGHEPGQPLHDEIVLVFNAVAKNLVPFQRGKGLRWLAGGVHSGNVALFGTERNEV